MTVRRQGRWMYPTDERILEHLAETAWATPKTIARETHLETIEIDEQYVRQRCEQLVDRELIAPVYDDMYEITSWGLAYLRGDLDAGTLPRWSVKS
jgi:hypothetical protein